MSVKRLCRLSILALSLLPSFAAAEAAPVAPGQRARVGHSLKNDTSPPLRSMRQVPPRRGPRIRVMPEPQPIPFPDVPKGTSGVESVAGALSSVSTPLSATAGVSFEGMPNLSGALPPDTNGDVGPNHYVQMVNSSYQMWNKAGASLLGPSDLSTLWTGFGLPCAGTNDGDPVVLYDSIADRWILSQFVAVAPYYGECIAVSQTGDPTGAYHRYYFPLSATVFYDYPHLGVWPDAYYMGTNKFNPTYAGSAVIAFERDKMLDGLAASYQEFATAFSGTPLPADLDGPTLPPGGAPNYVAQLNLGSAGPLRIYQFHVDWVTPGNSTLTGPTNLTTEAIAFLCTPTTWTCVPQPSTNVDLDTLGDRLMHRFTYRNQGTHEAMVVNHSVKTGSGQGRAAVRWYEVRRTGGVLSIFQQGTHTALDDVWRWMGSIAMDGSGNMGLGYSVSNNSGVFPGIRYTGRLADDPAGIMQSEATLIDGGASQVHTAARWGDYSSMSIDPDDDCTFWYTNEYYPTSPASTADWKTRIGSFGFGPGDCTPAPKGTVSGTVTDSLANPIPGVLVTADNGVSTITAADGTYALTLVPATYDVTASAPDRACDPEPSQPATVTNGGNTVADFQLSGSPLLIAIATVVDDAGGSNNGKINRDECFNVNVTVRNDGCAAATGITSTLAANTAGVSVTSANSNYPDLDVAESGGNATSFAVGTSAVFACGQTASFTLTTSLGAIPLSLPSCQGTQTINGSITAGDPAMSNRLGRAQPGSSCGNPKLCPGPFSTSGTYRYDTYGFTNTGDDACFTVSLDPLTCTGTNQLHSSAYLGTFDDTDVCLDFLADNGFDPTVPTNYSFTVPAGETVTIVVNEAASNGTCGSYNVTIPAIDDTAIGNCGGGTPAMTPVALLVDDAGNDVLEPGEAAVVVAPSWQNTGSAQATGLSGSGANLAGPVASTYTFDDTSAAYGNVSVAATASCASGGNCYAMTIATPADRTPRHWDATFDETLTAGLAGAKTWTLHVGESFTDVAASHAFYRHVETALHGGLSPGCDATGYCPDLPVTRSEIAMFLLRGKEGGAYSPPSCPGPDPYGDVAAGDLFCPWIQDAALNGYMNACDTAPTPDLFCPDAPVQRQQLAMLILRTVEGSSYTPAGCASQPYLDVDIADPYCPWIQEIQTRGITLGCDLVGNYCPLEPVTRSAMAALLGRGFGLTLYAP